MRSSRALPPDLKDTEWVKAAERTWNKSICWKEALALIAFTASSEKALQAVVNRATSQRLAGG